MCVRIQTRKPHQQGDRHLQQNNNGIRHWVSRHHANQQTLHQLCQSQRRTQPQCYTQQRQAHALSDNQLQDITGVRAQR